MIANGVTLTCPVCLRGFYVPRYRAETAKERGYLVDPSKDVDEKIPLAMIALVEAIEVWDFRLPAES